VSHMNFVAAMAGISDGTPGIGPEDFFLSYLTGATPSPPPGGHGAPLP